MRRFATAALTLFAAGAVGAETLDYASLAQLQATPYAQSQLRFIASATDRQQTDRLVQQARDVLADASLAAPLADFALSRVSLALAGLPATPAADALLRALTQRPVHAWLSHEHGSGASRVPAFDVAAAARFALRQHAVAADAAQLNARLADRNAGPVWTTPGTDLQRKNTAALSAAVATKAVTSVDQQSLTSTLPDLLAALPASPQLAGAVIAAAERLDDTRPLLAVIEHGSNQDALQALRVARRSTTESARQVIDAAIERSDTASAALTALAERVAGSPAEIPQLLHWLDHPPTALLAARAVARLDRADIAADIGERLHATNNRERATALALALTLMPNDEARRQLERYRATDIGPTELKRKLRAMRPEVAQ